MRKKRNKFTTKNTKVVCLCESCLKMKDMEHFEKFYFRVRFKKQRNPEPIGDLKPNYC